MATATLDDISIAYDTQGSGPKTLLLVHGHPFNRSMWHPQTLFAEKTGWRVVAPDLRGYGDSTVTRGTTPLDLFAADLAGLLDHLHIERVAIGGLSMGGQIAMAFCRDYPERVCGLLLAATFPQAESEEGRKARNAMADRLLREGMGNYVQEALPRMLAPGSMTNMPAVAALVEAMMRKTDPAGAAAALRGRADRPDYQETLATLKVPALVVVGDEDTFTTRQDAERMRDLLEDSELLWLSGIGHMPNLEASEEFNAGLGRLLRRIDPQ